MLNVTLYFRKDQTESQQIIADLKDIQNTIPHNLVLMDIELEAALLQAYGEAAPVVQVGPYKLQWPITKQELLVALGAARDRAAHLDQIGDKSYEQRKLHGQSWSKTDNFALWFSKNYMWVINFLLFLYVGLPFLAPLFLKANIPVGAKVIYAIYSPLCHQLPYRSFFLFGEQAIYPRELAGFDNLKSYETISGNDPLDMLTARRFVGDEHLGYKVALCERDIAIWGSLLGFGLIFTFAKNKIRALPWLAWLILGVLPMGLDGGSQLLGLITNAPGWIPVRESTPLLRIITGGLFGITTAWFMYPLIEDNMKDTRLILTQKSSVVRSTQENNQQ